MKTGIDLITEERISQFTKHGRTVEYDANVNDNGQLVCAACALLRPVVDEPDDWDYKQFEKMQNKTYKERLVIAGALIAAEIDRLQYK